MGDLANGFGGMLGFGAGSNNPRAGQGYTAAGVPIIQGATVNQANEARSDIQAANAQQQAFLQALQGQNGLGHTGDVYNQLAGIANGTGFNPAQAALNQATSQNIANQSALMAGQRGASANPALIARLAAQQGGALQQQAAGQGATLQAQQALGALGQMGNIAQNIYGTQAGVMQNTAQNALQQQSSLLNSINAQNNAAVGMQGNQNTVNSGIAQGVAQGQRDMFGSLTGAGGKALMAAGAKGGEVKGYAPGGYVTPNSFLGTSVPSQPIAGTASPSTGPSSRAGQFLSGDISQPSMGGGGPQPSALSAGTSGLLSGLGHLAMAGYNKLTSPYSAEAQDTSEEYGPATPLPTAELMEAKGGPIIGERYAKQMKPVPGNAKVKGDSLKNDIVDAKLSPGEVIIPRSVMQSKDPAKEAAKFVAAIMAKKRKSLPKKA